MCVSGDFRGNCLTTSAACADMDICFDDTLVHACSEQESAVNTNQLYKMYMRNFDIATTNFVTVPVCTVLPVYAAKTG